MSLVPLLTSLTVAAWGVEPIALPQAADAVVVLPRGGVDLVVVLGPSGIEAWDAAARSRVGMWPVGARDAAVLDIDGDALADLLACGDEGLIALPWEGTSAELRILSKEPCRAVEVLVVDGAASLVTAGESAHIWELEAGALVDRGAFGPALGAEALLATSGHWLAVAAAGGSEVTERGASGSSTLPSAVASTFATDGPIAGLAAGPRGWVWSVPGTSTITDVTHRSWAVAPDPGALASADLDGIDGPELYVFHPGSLGRIEGEVEIAGPLPLEPRGMAVGDVDADGCDEIVLLGAEPPALAFVEGRCALAPALAIAAELALPPPKVSHLLGTSIPAFVGEAPGEVGWPRNDVFVGLGWVVGGSLRGLPVQVPTFPAVAFGTEFGSPRSRWYAGLDSAGFFLWTWEGEDGGARLGMHLANVTLGRTFGGSDLSAGPFVTAGLLNVGAGMRAVWTPFPMGQKGRSGFEARLTWFAPRTGEAMLLYVSRSSQSRTGAASSSSRDPFCTRFELAAGASAGVSATALSWEFVGSDAAWAPSGSPALAVACESGERGGWLIGMETAPFFSYVVPPEGARLHHLGSMTVGRAFGGEAARVGPIATAGVWTLGAGARVAWTPFEDQHGQRHGFDLRAMALFPHGPSYEAMLLYGAWLDPRR